MADRVSFFAELTARTRKYLDAAVENVRLQVDALVERSHRVLAEIELQARDQAAKRDQATINALASYQEQVEARLATVKDGQDGKDGENGADGKDAPRIASVELDGGVLVATLTDESTVRAELTSQGDLMLRLASGEVCELKGVVPALRAWLPKGDAGQDGKDGENGKDGKDGADAPLPTSLSLDGADLVLTFGEGLNKHVLRLAGFADRVRGQEGKDGEHGKDGRDAPRMSAAYIERGTLVLVFGDAEHVVELEGFADKVRGEPGRDGTDGKDAPTIKSVTLDGADLVVQMSDDEAHRIAGFADQVRGADGRDGKDAEPVVPVRGFRRGDDIVFELSNGSECVVERAYVELRGDPGDKGRDGTDGRDGRDGQHGRDGFSIVGAAFDHETGALVLERSDGTKLRVEKAAELLRGPAGKDGADGRDGSDGATWEWCGVFSLDVADSYTKGSVVALDGSSYVAVKDAPGPCPGDGWRCAASRGKPGRPGDRGERGLKGNDGRDAPVPEPVVQVGWLEDWNGLTVTPVWSDGSKGVPLNLAPLAEAIRRSLM